MRIICLLLILTAPPSLAQVHYPVRPTPCRAAPVPAEPPDSVPRWAYAAERMPVHGSPYITGVFPRDVVIVEFAPGTTVRQKQRAIDAICGTVVGGRLITGAYAVRIADHPEGEILFGAIEVLQRFRWVREAFPEMLMVEESAGLTGDR